MGPESWWGVFVPQRGPAGASNLSLPPRLPQRLPCLGQGVLLTGQMKTTMINKTDSNCMGPEGKEKKKSGKLDTLEFIPLHHH